MQGYDTLTRRIGMTKKGKAVLVTTEFRGVFFGFLKEQDGQERLTLGNARNCIYWSADVGGFLGLAATGPTSSCKIGKEVTELTIYKITSITPVSTEAVSAWQSA